MGWRDLSDPGPPAPMLFEMIILCFCLIFSTIMPGYEKNLSSQFYIRMYRYVYYIIQLKGVDSILCIYYNAYGEDRYIYRREYFTAYLCYLFIVFVASLGSWSLMF